MASKTNDILPESNTRPIAVFHQDVWGDYFLRYASTSSIVDNKTEEHSQQLKEKVKSILAMGNKLSQTLELVDTIQRLGFSYHFEEELGEIMKMIKNIRVDDLKNDNLHIISLWFRLLRQEGYGISSEIFKKFTNEEGKFRDELTSDIQGMLSLYEASHLMVIGESILEEALSFTTHHLRLSIAPPSNMSSFLAAQVKHALERPIRKGLPRVEAKFFISIYHQNPSHSEILLNFAKLDFNTVQEIHQKELCELTRWWKELDLKSKLPYYRERLAECCFWMMQIYFEPKYGLGRKIISKISLILLVIDDTYDAYGKIKELEDFTNAVHSWNINCLDQLPEYMKIIYKTMLDIYDDIEEIMVNEGRGSHRIQYAKKSMMTFCQAYLEEAEWCSKDYVPTMEEYMEQAILSGGQFFFVINSFLGMEDIATEEAFEWASNHPKIIRAGAVIVRLVHDIVSHKFERERVHVASSVECYQKQYGTSEEETYREFRRRISDAWKEVNEEWINDQKVLPMPLLNCSLNYTRFVDVLYKDDDTFTRPGGLMKDLIKLLLVDPLPL